MFTNTKNGEITIEKQTVGGDGDFDFTSGDVATFDAAQLSDNETSGPVSVEPGNYAVSEDSQAGWNLTDLACSDSAQDDADDSNTDLGTATATFDVQPGEEITCVFTNTKNGEITIEKQTVGGDGDFDFTSGDVATFDAAQLSDDETSGPVSVEPGNYAVSEDSQAGWNLTDLACSDSAQDDADDSNTDLGTGTATFDVQPGEQITCVFTNTKNGEITIEKQTVGGDGDFDFTSGDVATFDAAQLSDDETSGPVSVEPGNYAVSEDSQTGWDLTDLECSDAAQDDADDSNTDVGTRTATFDVQPGEQITCVFTNTKRGKVIVVKQTDPDGAPDAFEFTSDLPGHTTFDLSDGQSETADNVLPGDYEVAENVPAGWALKDIVCTGDNGAR